MLVTLTIQSRKVFGKSACNNPERYCGWFCVHSSSEPHRHSLNFSFVSFIYQMQECIPRASLLGKQVMSRTCAVRYSALSAWKAFTSTRNQIYVRVRYIKKSASILPIVSFDPRYFTENLFLSKL